MISINIIMGVKMPIKIGIIELTVMSELLISKKPMTKYALSKKLNCDINTIKHHLEKLVKYGAVIETNGDKKTYAISSKKSICYDQMVIVFIDSNPVIFGCPYYDDCAKHDCGSDSCELVRNAVDPLKKLIKR